MLRLSISRLVANPFEGARRDEAKDQKIPSTEAGRIFPCVAFFVCALKRDVEHRSVVGFVAPDTRTYGAMTDFVDGLRNV